MKVFISHHLSKDEKLAGILLNSLKKRGISGYMAERKQEYEILILDKIKNEIDSSDYLVAIITKNGLKSASIHEEIGYAIGIDVPVILMVDESVEEQGVLIHGKEPEYFTAKFFESHSDEIAKHILSKGIPKRKGRKKPVISKEKDQYQQYNPQQRITKLQKDLVESFIEHGFSSQINKLEITIGPYWREIKKTVKIVVSENKKRKERFFSICLDELKNEEDVKELNIAITEIFNKLPFNSVWKNMCLIITHGNVSKSRIDKYYKEISREKRKTKQNTIIIIDPSIIYYGVGQGVSGFTQKYWNFSSSLPKFIAYGIKSKNDLIARIGIIDDFIEGHEKIFKQVTKLRANQKKLQIIPEKKAEQKRKKKQKEEEKKRGIRRAKILKRRTVSRRHRYNYGSYGGNPAYIGTPKE